MRTVKFNVGLVAVVAVICLGICANLSAITCVYQPGTSETVRYSTTDSYRNWVEMGNSSEPSQMSSRVISQSVTMQRNVLSVAEDGSALIEITITEAQVTLDKTLQGEDSTRTYHSTTEETTSTWSDVPAIAGVSYQIRQAPDSTVLEITGLDEARAALGIGAEGGVVSEILSDEFVRACHQHDFILSGVEVDSPAEMMIPVTNVMIKAQAIEESFTAVGIDNNMIAVMISGEPIHVLPEGIAEPPQPRDWGRSLIKDRSDMSEFALAGIGQFNSESNTVITDTSTTSAMLVLLEENVFPNAAPEGQSSGNVMFTAIDLTDSYEVVD
ncbi:MAG: hypothetical protein JW936_06595 [Sedimentisphaerales bacterium]|nr:hypothetical protein [Sedimentisphaerales bacterium]